MRNNMAAYWFEYRPRQPHEGAGARRDQHVAEIRCSNDRSGSFCDFQPPRRSVKNLKMGDYRIFAGAALTTLLGGGAELAAPENLRGGESVQPCTSR
ncbi:MAG: hypothetical protein E2591_30775 [Achromobacter sp.]|uniref:Uncharacterized protein n=2 Tax=Achromobacter TaxID=222 RepID=A0AAW3HZ69_9BURK|nr:MULTISPECIES: hypothetical protein [Achromobacter]KNE24888.1 hypothetical protein AFM18_23970 [Achromobacter spanius]MDH2051250.1 hypothetical protein [Achromobacter marplatensis]MPS82452.1 hypothetical protein [Achromobacter sp.]